MITSLSLADVATYPSTGVRATCSSLLTWLENSSGGVHALEQMMHYAVFSDDVCIEVLTRVVPALMSVEL